MKKRLLAFSITLSILLGFSQPVFAHNEKSNNEQIQISKIENGKIIENTDNNIEKLEKDFPKISNYLKSQKIESNQDGKVTMLVEFEEGKKEEGLEELKKIPNLKVKYVYDLLINGASIEVPIDQAKKIFKIDEIKDAVESQQVEPAMHDAKQIIRVVQARKNSDINGKYNADGRGMVIASIDSGADLTHKDLQMSDEIFNKYAKIKVKNPKGPFTNKVPHGFNYADGNFELKDNFFAPHGQHIAGILAGSASVEEDEKGLGVRGVAPNAQLLVYRIFSDGSEKDGYTPTSGDDAVYHAMEDAIKHGADVISLSIGNPGVGRRGDLYDTAIRKAQEYGVAVVVSMGNYGASSSESTYDNYTNNAFGNIDTSMTVSGAANPHAIGVAASRNTGVLYPTVAFDGKDYPVADIGRNFEFKEAFKLLEPKEYEVLYLGKGSAKDFMMFEDKIEGKIVAVARDMDDKNLVWQKLDRAKLSGAKGFILVNDIINKNRDTYMEEVPTGFENLSQKHKDMFSAEDELIPAIGISGNTGKKLFGLSDKNEERLKPIDKVFKIKIQTKDYKTKAVYGEETTIAGFSAWGPNNQLELKPDITAPGQEILSIGNNDTYVQMSGTSMSQPVIAGVTTLLYSKIKEDMQSLLITPKFPSNMDNRAVPKVPEEVDKFTRPELAKFLMMSTANPMRDRTVEVDGEFLENSPRHQGAGQVNIENAFLTNVILSHKGRPSVSLKEIGETTTFTVNLHNFSDKDQEFNIETGKVITDNIVKVEKEKSGGGYDTVNEIHPKVIEGSSIKPSVDIIKVPANSKVSVEFTLNVNGKDIFAEGYIYFKSKNSDEPNLSIPYMGFLGNWGKERIVDLPEWEEGSKTKLTTLLEGSQSHDGAEGSQKKIGVDGMIPNNDKVNPEMLATNGFEVVPRIITLRDANDYKVSIVDKDKNVLQVLQHSHFYKKYIHAHFLERPWYPPMVLKPNYEMGWRGAILNKDWKLGTVDFDKNLPDGQYYFKLEFRSTDKHEYQVDYLPIKIDRTPPEFTDESIKYDRKNKTLTIKVKDNFGIIFLGASLDGKSLDVKRQGDDYKTFIVENVELKASTNNTLVVEARDFGGNNIRLSKDLSKGNQIVSYENLDGVKRDENVLRGKFDKEYIDSVNAKLNGKPIDVEIEDGSFEIKLINLEAKNNLEIEFKKNGRVVSTEIIQIFRDSTRPEIKDIKVTNLDNNKALVEGKIIDDISLSKNIRVGYNNIPRIRQRDYDRNSIQLNEDGTFKVTLSKNDYYVLFIFAKDEAGNQAIKRVQLGGQGYNEDTENADENHSQVVKSQVSSHVSFDGGREVIYPGSFAAWIAYSPDSISRNDNVIPGNLNNIEEEPYRVKITYHGMPGDVMKVTSYNPVLKGYEELVEPNLTQYPKEYTFKEEETVSLAAVLYNGFNSVNLKVVDADGNVRTNRGYTFHIDSTGPGLELFNVKMPESKNDGSIPKIYFPSEDYVLEGKIYDDANDVYFKVDDVQVESWILFGERNQERRFRHEGRSENGQIIKLVVEDKFGSKERYEFETAIDSIKPVLNIDDIDNLNGDSELKVEARDENLWEYKTSVNGKEYTGGPLRNYEIEGQEGKYFVYSYAKDLAGNKTEITKAINMDEDLPSLKLLKDKLTAKDAQNIENVFDIPEGIKASYIEYADRYESAKLDDEWYDKDTLNPYRKLDKIVLREEGENSVNIVLEDVFGRKQVHTYIINIGEEIEEELQEEPKPQEEPNEDLAQLDEGEKINKEKLLQQVKLKKTEYKPTEFKGIADELEHPDGVKLKLKNHFDSSSPGKKLIVVEITKGDLVIEKTFEINVVSNDISNNISENDSNLNSQNEDETNINTGSTVDGVYESPSESRENARDISDDYLSSDNNENNSRGYSQSSSNSETPLSNKGTSSNREEDKKEKRIEVQSNKTDEKLDKSSSNSRDDKEHKNVLGENQSKDKTEENTNKSIMNILVPVVSLVVLGGIVFFLISRLKKIIK
ncbi:S8 family serine peptidase [Helcococcus bovis]|uniref:S8 family serine peptidase n=1 Tax=Helcococcus bovis TaxID=3153252 RepID=UPI0038BC5A68